MNTPTKISNKSETLRRRLSFSTHKAHPRIGLLNTNTTTISGIRKASGLTVSFSTYSTRNISIMRLNELEIRTSS